MPSQRGVGTARNCGPGCAASWLAPSDLRRQAWLTGCARRHRAAWIAPAERFQETWRLALTLKHGLQTGLSPPVRHGAAVSPARSKRQHLAVTARRQPDRGGRRCARIGATARRRHFSRETAIGRAECALPASRVAARQLAQSLAASRRRTAVRVTPGPQRPHRDFARQFYSASVPEYCRDDADEPTARWSGQAAISGRHIEQQYQALTANSASITCGRLGR